LTTYVKWKEIEMVLLMESKKMHEGSKWTAKRRDHSSWLC